MSCSHFNVKVKCLGQGQKKSLNSQGQKNGKNVYMHVPKVLARGFRTSLLTLLRRHNEEY